MPFVLCSPWRIGVPARFDWSLSGLPQAILIPKTRFGCVRIAGTDIEELRGLNMRERRDLAETFHMRSRTVDANSKLMQSMEFAARHDALLKLVTSDGHDLIFACDETDASRLLLLTASPPPTRDLSAEPGLNPV